MATFFFTTFNDRKTMRHLLLIVLVAIALIICVIRLKAEPKEFFEANKSTDRETLLKKGTSFIHKNEPDSAIAYFVLAAQQHNSTNLSDKESEICAKALSNAGYVHLFCFNDYPAAYSAIVSSNDIAHRMELTHIQCINDINLGSIYSLNKDFDEAAQLYRQALGTAIRHKYYNQMIVAFVDLADIYFNEKDNIECMKKDMEIFPVDSLPASNPVTPYIRNIYYGLQCAERGDTNSIGWFNRAKDSLLNVHKGERYRYNTDFMISRILQHNGRHLPAANRLKQMLRDSAIGQNPDIESMAYLRIAQCYRQARMHDSAQYYKMRHLELNDSIAATRKMMEVKDLKASHDRQVFASEITRMTDANIFQRRILASICIALVIVLSLLIWIAIKNRQLHSRNVELYMRNRELLELHDSQTHSLPPQSETSKDRGKLMPGSEFIIALCDKIQAALNSEEIFSPSFNSSRLASLCDTNTRYLSAALAEMKEGGFPALLAEARVREAMRRLDGTDNNYSNLTIEAIGESVGFKSRSSFSASFKRVTGLTPNEYRKISIEKNKKSNFS